MAASDQTYRNQRGLHLVFAVSSVAMLATTVWMFWDDYNRPYKHEQRVFREVEEELAKRSLLHEAPTDVHRDAVVKAEKAVAHARAVVKDVRAQADVEVRRLTALWQKWADRVSVVNNETLPEVKYHPTHKYRKKSEPVPEAD